MAPKKKPSGARLSQDLLRRLHRELLLPRLIEERMLLLLRQGRISKWFSGIGQEAIAVGASLALDSDEYILPLHRNLGVFTTRGMDLTQLVAQFQGKPSGFTKGRDRSFHFGSIPHHVVGMISHLGPQLSVACGIALGHKLRKEKKVTLVFSGEGGTSEGEFHEALNVAAVWELPVIFLVENNGYGLSTPSAEQFRCKQIADRASGYGMRGLTIDGNDLLEVYTTVSKLAGEMRKKPAPVLLECMTFRMRGHEEASGIKYVPKELLAKWEKLDPIMRFESSLRMKKVLTRKELSAVREEIAQRIIGEIEAGLSAPDCVPEAGTELGDVYAPSSFSVVTPAAARTKRRFVDAISDGLRESMKQYPELVIMGQDVAEYGGVFKVTDGFMRAFGRKRVRNTPLCESAIVGAALGLSMKGMKSVVEMQFADFVTCAFTQIVNNLAKLHYRWGEKADVVIRMPTGAGVRAGPFHSQSCEAWFFHVPGLILVYPSSPTDAKGLIAASIENPNPVLYFEHKALYRSIEEEVPDGYFTIELGKAKLVSEGSDVTVITYGAGVHWARETLARRSDISADLIDLRTLLPYDWEAIVTSVRKTGRVIVLHEATLTGGIGAELAARISSELFELLDAPVLRSAALDTPVPFTASLEEQFLPKKRFEQTLDQLLRF